MIHRSERVHVLHKNKHTSKFTSFTSKEYLYSHKSACGLLLKTDSAKYDKYTI